MCRSCPPILFGSHMVYVYEVLFQTFFYAKQLCTTQRQCLTLTGNEKRSVCHIHRILYTQTCYCICGHCLTRVNRVKIALTSKNAPHQQLTFDASAKQRITATQKLKMGICCSGSHHLYNFTKDCWSDVISLDFSMDKLRYWFFFLDLKADFR